MVVACGLPDWLERGTGLRIDTSSAVTDWSARGAEARNDRSITCGGADCSIVVRDDKSSGWSDARPNCEAIDLLSAT